MKKAIQIVEDNFRLNSDEYSKLMGMLQELQQCRDRLVVIDARKIKCSNKNKEVKNHE